MSRVEADPASPHGCFLRNNRGNLAHADLQRGVTRRKLRPVERADEVDGSERENNARTQNHQKFCSQDSLPIFRDTTPRSGAGLLRNQQPVYSPVRLQRSRCRRASA